MQPILRTGRADRIFPLHMTDFRYTASHMPPLSPPRVFPKERDINNPRALLRVAHKLKNIGKKHAIDYEQGTLSI